MSQNTSEAFPRFKSYRQPRPEERALARVSKDGHRRDRASGHPSRRAPRGALLRIRLSGLNSVAHAQMTRKEMMWRGRSASRRMIVSPSAALNGLPSVRSSRPRHAKLWRQTAECTIGLVAERGLHEPLGRRQAAEVIECPDPQEPRLACCPGNRAH